MTKTIETELARVNYRRRVRTIDRSDVLQSIREALSGELGYVRGGTVANSYDYPATTAIVASVKSANRIYIAFSSINAKGSTHTWLGCASALQSHVDEYVWSLNQFPLTETAHNTLARYDIVLTVREAQRMLRDETAQQASRWAAQISAIPDVKLTIEASLAVGNCQHETARVAERFHGKPTNARMIARAFPALIRYIDRAAQFVARQSA